MNMSPSPLLVTPVGWAFAKAAACLSAFGSYSSNIDISSKLG